MIDPSVFLIAIAVLFGVFAVFIVFATVISQRVFSKKAEGYYAKLTFRTTAMVIDISILSLIIDPIWSILNPGHFSLIVSSFAIFFVNPIAGLMNLIFALGVSVFFYLLFYIPVFDYSTIFGPSLIIPIFGFVYFYLCDAYFGGKTVGRRVIGIETLHESRERTLTEREAGINAFGKIFLLLDLLLGFITSAFDSRDPEQGQVRLTQKLARSVTKDTYYNVSTEEEWFQRKDDNTDRIW